MAGNAHARAADPGSAVGLDELIAAENSASTSTGQPVTLPTLAEARDRLLEVIRRRPEPKPEATILDVRRWERDGRRADAARMLKAIPPHPVHVATVLDVTPRAVQYWRRAERSPTIKHWRQLRALYALCRADLWRAGP